MGINQAFSSWLRGAQSTATAALRAARGYGATLQTQTMTAISAAQRAATQPFQQQTRAPASSNPHTTRTLTPADALARTVQGGVRGAQEAVQQIARAHAPIVQGVRRDVARAAQAAPAAVRSAPAAVQQAARQISAAHAPIVQGVRRDAGRAIQSAPAAVRSAPTAARQSVQQVARAHSSIPQGIQRDVGRATQAIPAPVRSAVSSVARAHAPIARGIQRDAARAVSAGVGAASSAMSTANQRKAAAQAELTRVAGPAVPFEKGWTHPIYEAGQEANRRYQGFVDAALPLYQRVQPLPNIPEIHSLQRGFARAPGSLLEGLTFIPPAAERGGQLLWKEPHKLPETAARFAGQMYEGMGASYERDPWDFGGEMLGTAVLSYGIGAAARPGGVTRGSGAAARPSRAAAGSTQGSGHAGGRFRAMEFGFRTELIRKPVQKQTPFKLSEWQAERQKYARTTPTSVQTTRPAPARQVQIQVEPPGTAPGGGASGQRAGFGAPYLGYGGPLSPATTTPADQAVEMLTQPQIGPQRGGIPGQRLANNPQVSSQDLGVVQEQGSRQDTILALVNAPVSSILDQPLEVIQPTRLLNPTKLVTAPPPSRLKHPPVVPLLTAPPRPKAKKEKKKKGNAERRRRRKLGELDHWEIGPAPGLDEMGMLVFGSRPARQRGSYLDFGPPSVGAGAVGISPKNSPAKKVAHAAKTKDTPRKRGKSSGRTKNSKR